jgi:exopolysaccharide production protein ExoQ
MPTLTLSRPDREITELQSDQPVPRSLRWLLVLPLVFFAAHGAFSFQSVGYVAERGMPGVMQARTRGLVGGVLIPGVAYSIAISLIWSELRSVISFAKQFKMLTFLALLAGISAVWSEDPVRSALFGLFYLLGTLFAYYLVIRFDPEEIIGLVMRAGVVVLSLSYVLVVLFPKFGIMHVDPRVDGAWQGIFIDRASAAKCLVFLLSPALTLRGKIDGRRLVYILAMSLMVFETRAVTAIVALVVYIPFVVLLRLSRRLDGRLLLLAFLTCFAGAFLLLGVAVEHGADALYLVGRDPTLSGRTEVWNAVMGSILKRPMLGYGYYAFWQTPSGELTNLLHMVHWSFGYAHNGILEIALQLGVLGVAVFGATLLRAVRDCWFCFRNDTTGRYDWFVGLIMLTILYNIDEATVMLPNELLSILYVVACCSLAQATNELRLEGRPAYL